MIIWQKIEQNVNIKDIMKVIDILPCSWTEDYCIYDDKNIELIPKPMQDGDNLIYAICDGSDGYVELYYKCAADGTILEIGFDADKYL